MKEEYCGIILQPGCNNDCLFCGRLPAPPNKDIRIQEVKVMKNLKDFKEQGYSKIDISGNDPIEYDKISPLIRYIKNIGFKLVQLSTHGVDLHDEKFCTEIIESGVDLLRIPIHGSNSAIHDSITQNTGSFEKSMKGINFLLKNNKKVLLTCMIMQQNKDDLIKIFDMFCDLGVENYFTIPFVANKDYSYYVPLKDLKKRLIALKDHAKNINKPIRFLEIPYCAFGCIENYILNKIDPPDLGKYNQPPDKYRTSVKNMPAYRIKRKEEICNSCIAADRCGGFIVRDIERYGLGDLKPIRHTKV